MWEIPETGCVNPNTCECKDCAKLKRLVLPPAPEEQVTPEEQARGYRLEKTERGFVAKALPGRTLEIKKLPFH